jgi:glucokinase
MPGWDRFPLKDLLQQELGLPVYVGNDANLAGLGEHRYGAGRGVSHLVYLTVSTGIGGGVIVAGKLLLGADGLAGEVGHMTLEAQGPRCNCGNTGCLEALAAGPAVARQGAAALNRGESPGLSALAHGQAELVTAKTVVEAARNGDVVARSVVDRAGFYLGVGVVNLIHLFNPQLVVIGGGFAIGAGEMLFEPVRRAVEERVMPPFRQALRIVPAALGDDAGLMGAAALALEDGLAQAPSARPDCRP